MDINDETLVKIFESLMSGEPVTFGTVTGRIPLVEVNEKDETVVHFEVTIEDAPEPLRATLIVHKEESNKV